MSINDKNTPGPWRVGGDGFMATGINRKQIGSNTPISIVSDGGSYGWNITTYVAYVAAGSTEKRLANAHLLAAAPVLLGACRNFIAAINEIADAEQPTSTDWANLKSACAIGRTAVGRAEGGGR